MEWKTNYSILLVGEGDFSFSLALCNKLNKVDSHFVDNIISTSYDENEGLNKHVNVSHNVAQLRDLGVEVLHGIDATKLETYKFAKDGKKIGRIVFNFPHVGGKSNIKKNRQLLRDFFVSASQILAPDGDVLVTLARGQGGTPADNPRRLWGDSWQVVAMAAYGDLILTWTEPFRREEYLEYACTGFRSRDQWFHTEDAVVHRFIRALPSPAVRATQLYRTVTLGGEKYLVQNYLADRLEWNPPTQPAHPVAYVHDLLTSSLGDYDVIPTPSPFLEASANEAVSYLALRMGDGTEANVDENISMSHQRRLFPECEKSTSCLMRTSLLAHQSNIHEFATNHSSPTLLLRGLCYRRGPVTDETEPANQELCIIIRRHAHDETDVVSDEWVNVMDDLESHVIKRLWTPLDLHVTYTNDVEMNVNIYGAQILGCAICQSKCVGYFGTFDIEDSTYTFISLNLNEIACCKFRIVDRRILWSRDERLSSRVATSLSEKLEQLNLSSGCQNDVEYAPLSLYPCEWKQDLSFWLGVDFDEQTFYDIARNVGGENLRSLTFVEDYTNSSGRYSRNYRLVMQSCDHALSRHAAHGIYEAIRLQSSKILGVEMK